MIRSVYRRRPTTGEVNLTPLVDVTFQLIIFFILAGAFASGDRVELDVPMLASTEQVPDLKLPHKTVVHVAPYPSDRRLADPSLRGPAAYWQVGAVRLDPGDRAGLAEQLARYRAAFEQRRQAGRIGDDAVLQVEIRADRSVWYAEVEPVLVSAAEAGFERIHYVATGSEGH